MVVRLKPIIGKSNLSVRAMERELNKAIAATLDQAVIEFKKTTRTWDTKVTFYVTKVSDFRGAAGTDSIIYTYVTRGTRPHLITPVRSKYLVFGQGVYSARTTPGVLGSRQIGTGLQGTGGVARPIFAKRVHHPGTKARGFEGAVAKRLQRVHERNVTIAIAKAID